MADGTPGRSAGPSSAGVSFDPAGPYAHVPAPVPSGRRRRRAQSAAGTLAPDFSPWIESLRAAAERIGARLAADWAREAISGRLILWLVPIFAAGILLYFGAASEPSLSVALATSAGLALICGLARAHFGAFALALAAFALSAGFATATLRTALLDRPAYAPPKGPVRLVGFVEQVERRAKNDRIVLRVSAVEGWDAARVPGRVRLTVRSGTAPKVGTLVRQLAQLLPPLGPALPGAHDFGRGPWFRGIDAVGYGLGRPQPVAEPPPAPLSVRLAMLVADVRETLASRIRASLTGTPAEIAVALVAGDRTGIPQEVEDGMRVSGLTHILSISGLHMAMVAGTLFFLVRGLLAAVPGLALVLPLKSIAAAAALAGSAFYLVLAGNDFPAQRSFVMAGLVLLGVLFARPALTLRTVAVAALIVLVLAPEAVLEPGTQMSFSATLALVAAYEHVRPLRARAMPDSVPARLLAKIGLIIAGTIFTSLVAGLASAPYGALHFQRMAPYGILANLLATPAVSLLVMPFGLAGVLLMPFGWDVLAWPVMGAGIEAMMAVSDAVAALPGADARIQVMGVAATLLLTLALLMACLLRGSLIAFAAVPLVGALLALGAPARPDVLVSADARTLAVRGADGRLSILGAKANRLTAQQWLEREGDRRVLDDPALAAAFSCDPIGCTARLADGGILAVSREASAIEADCLNADLVVARQQVPASCPARAVTPDDLEALGTLARYWTGTKWREETARPPVLRRPWMPPAPVRAVRDAEMEEETSSPTSDIMRLEAEAGARGGE